MANWFKKKKRRGLFDPLGQFKINIFIEDACIPNSVVITSWINFYKDSESNMKLCVEDYIADGVWANDEARGKMMFYPHRQILKVEITDEKRFEKYDD